LLLAVAWCWWLVVATSPAYAQGGDIPCVGDCAIDGSVTVDEIVVGVSIALGQSGIDRCVMFDRSRDGFVTVDEILAAVAAALSGCRQNQPPTAGDLPDYFTYPDQEVRIVLAGMDADDDHIEFSAAELPPGAAIDSATGELSWMPSETDVGSYLVSYTVTDDGLPSLAASGSVRLEVQPANACLALECDPATGCTSMPLDLAFDCCPAPPAVRHPAPLPDCPEGAMIAIGRNFEGFGPLETCDILPLNSSGQGGTKVILHLAARCIRSDVAPSMRVQLYTADHVLVNVTQPSAPFDAAENGFVVRRNKQFGVDDRTVEPALFEGDEAHLSVTVQDADGLFLEKTIRVLLTLSVADDLPDESSPSLPEEGN
jgi:hypothetical protein